MTNCKELKAAVSSFSLVEDCDEVENGVLRVATPFSYPDGSQIDVFLKPDPNHLFAPFDLSDMGQTTINLLDLQIKVWATKKRKQVVSDICDALNVQNRGGVLHVGLKDLSELSDGILRLTQACIRVSDLMFTQRLAAPVAFRDDVEEFLATSDFNYEPSVEILGPYGKPVSVDFSVDGPQTNSLILTIGTANAATAHPVANEVFRRWHDLAKVAKNSQFISLFDSRNNAVRDDDVARLGDVSTVLAFPDQQEDLRRALAA
jgi:hypothetical protein